MGPLKSGERGSGNLTHNRWIEVMERQNCRDTLPDSCVYSLTGGLNSRANLDDFRQFYADKGVNIGL